MSIEIRVVEFDERGDALVLLTFVGPQIKVGERSDELGRFFVVTVGEGTGLVKGVTSRTCS